MTDLTDLIEPVEALARREALGLSQEALAAALTGRGVPVSQDVISRLERGQRVPRAVGALAGALADLETDLETMIQRIAHAAASGAGIQTFTADRDLWRADPVARARAIPATMHRVAAARAAARLAEQGRRPPIRGT